MATSLEGRLFRDVTPERSGDVGEGTIFEYHEDDDRTVWARYSGGDVRLGFLVGTRSGDSLDFRYAHVTAGGETAAGRCVTRVEQRDDGRLRLHEAWSWESKPGSGTSLLEEIYASPMA